MTFPSALAGKVGKACANAFQVISFVCVSSYYSDLSKEIFECELFRNRNSLLKI